MGDWFESEISERIREREGVRVKRWEGVRRVKVIRIDAKNILKTFESISTLLDDDMFGTSLLRRRYALDCADEATNPYDWLQGKL